MSFKVKFRTLFPGLFSATSPITLVKNGFSYVIGLNLASLFTSLDARYAPVSTISTDPTFYAYDFGVRGDGGSYTTQMQNCLNAAKAAGGGVVVMPAGSFICGQLTYTTTNAGVSGQGIQIRGQGAQATQVIFSGASNFWLTLDTTADGKWQSFASISDFKLTAIGTNAGGVSVHRCGYITIERMHFLTTGTALYNYAAGDPDSTFQGFCRHVRFDNCALTANTFAVDIFPSGTAVEISCWRFEGCQWEACGVAGAAVTPPTSGAMRYRGLILELVNCGFTTNQNSALYIAKTGGVQAVTIDSCDFENTISTVLPHIYCDTGLRLLKMTNGQFLNQDSWKCQGGIWFDSTAGVQGNITIDGVTVRVSTGNNPFVVFKQVGTASNWAADLNRVRNINYQTYDGTGQTRYSSAWQFDFIPGQCQLTVSGAGTVKLAPFGGGATMPLRLAGATSEFVPYQVPSAGASAGGLVALSVNTRYYMYFSNSAAITAAPVGQLSLSAAAPTLDSATGYYVSSVNSALLYVGWVVTDGSGNVATTSPVYSFYPQALPPGQAPATITNDNALVGNQGEYVESVIAAGSAVALVTGTAKTITSITLTAGDWDVSIMGYILPAGGTSTSQAIVSLSSVTNTFNATPGRFCGLILTAGTFTGGNEIGLPLPPYRISLSATTTLYFVAQSTFTVSTSAAYGIIRARRVR